MRLCEGLTEHTSDPHHGGDTPTQSHEAPPGLTASAHRDSLACWWAPYASLTCTRETPGACLTSMQSPRLVLYMPRLGPWNLVTLPGRVSAWPPPGGLSPLSGCCPGMSGHSAPWKRSLLSESSLPVLQTVSASLETTVCLSCWWAGSYKAPALLVQVP